ncbi:MAG: methyltransferase type 12 [Ignavibacteriae bacterium HGW-Ignavibacteriae-3]|nr:MAG: methyltransferase type 12 [Ignavibacteriae bacterium HGW-Ignavibacteriae-3]
MENPWLKIPAEDYEGHMSAPNVQQLQMLGEIFADLLKELSPKSICVLGCATGNGFEYLIGKNAERIVGVDINPEYISLCKSRFVKSLNGPEFICADLNEIDFPESSFDLVHAALIFEYVDVESLMDKIRKWLRPAGNLSVVLQMAGSGDPNVSETPYHSVKLLSDFIELVEPEEFKRIAVRNRLVLSNESEIKSSAGKRFTKMIFKK